MRQIPRHALALGLVLALSACGGDPEPQFEADPSPTPSEVTSSAPAKEAWEEKSPEGAVAFAEHWTATFSEAFQTGETKSLVAISTKDCEGCNFFTSLIREVYDGGGSISGSAWRLTDAGWSTLEDESVVAVAGRMRIPEQTISRSGESPTTAAPTVERYIFTVTWSDGGWKTQSLISES